MSELHDHDPQVPRSALYGAAAAIGLTLLVTFGVRSGAMEGQASPTAQREAAGITMVSTRSLRFTDEKGAVVVRDVSTGEVVSTVAAGSNQGFIRGVLRGLARERRMNGIGQEPPFTLTLYSDSQLTLLDTATNRLIEIGSFGPTNRAAFAALLPPSTKEKRS